jgi:hypothetical protein
MESITHRAISSMTKALAGLCLLSSLLAALAQPQPESDSARLWHAYAARFISGDGRVLDPQNNDWTTSEGQSYALFFALVNNDRARFDKLIAWTESNLASNDLGAHLPAWGWGKAKDGNWGVFDMNSAADSDLWIAYDLIEAGRLWKDLHYANTRPPPRYAHRPPRSHRPARPRPGSAAWSRRLSPAAILGAQPQLQPAFSLHSPRQSRSRRPMGRSCHGDSQPPRP